MSDSLTKRLEAAAYAAVVVLALVTSGVLVKRFFIEEGPDRHDPRIAAGTKVSLPGVDWARSGRTLVLAVSPSCRYCTESAPFYRRLAAEAGRLPGVRLLAVTPTPEAESRGYVEGLAPGLEVVPSALDRLGVSATPMLLLVGRDGVVEKSWVGKLPEDEEADVLARLKG